MRRALDSLPAELREAMSNVEIVVEDENPEDPDLFGLYLGIPLTERGGELRGRAARQDRHLPAARSKRSSATTPSVLEEEIRITVLHEIAHHFGIDEDRLAELGWS